MSGIYFHAQGRGAAVRVSGAERAYAGVLIGDLTCAALGLLGTWGPKYLEPALRRERYPGSDVTTLIRISEDVLELDGRRVSTWLMSLQTALTLGSDPLRFLARVHGQCEIHGYVEGPNRAWLAGIIDAGRASSVLRAGVGWEGVAALLRAAADAPVVMSYSVTESFPSLSAARDGGFVGDGDAWEELPAAERWSQALAGIRRCQGLELKPDDWASFRFREVSAFELVERVAPVPRAPAEQAR